MPRRKSYEIRVTVREKNGVLYLRFRHPITGEETLRRAKGKFKSEALREAVAWELELRENSGKAKAEARPELATWEVFRNRFSIEHLKGLSENTDTAYSTILDQVEKLLDPKPILLTDITATSISQLQVSLQTSRSSDATVAKYLRHFKAALKWAQSVDLLTELPKFPAKKRAATGANKTKPMKGRPITEEGFRSSLEFVSQVVPAEMAASWKSLLEGFWFGGLRLEEALSLSWDLDDVESIRVDLDSAKFPRLIIPKGEDKSQKPRLFPIAPEYADLLRKTPTSERRGLVYPLSSRKGEKQVTAGYASHVITEICRKAGVVTNSVRHKSRDGKLGSHFAGAHDFRRSFGTRWARRVLPQILQLMMRHDNIATTLAYYVEIEVDDAASDIWRAYELAISSESNQGSKKGSTEQSDDTKRD